MERWICCSPVDAKGCLVSFELQIAAMTGWTGVWDVEEEEWTSSGNGQTKSGVG